MWPFVYERVEGLLESREGSYVQTLGCKCVSISGAPNLSKGEGGLYQVATWPFLRQSRPGSLTPRAGHWVPDIAARCARQALLTCPPHRQADSPLSVPLIHGRPPANG